MIFLVLVPIKIFLLIWLLSCLPKAAWVATLAIVGGLIVAAIGLVIAANITVNDLIAIGGIMGLLLGLAAVIGIFSWIGRRIDNSAWVRNNKDAAEKLRREREREAAMLWRTDAARRLSAGPRPAVGVAGRSARQPAGKSR